MPAWLSVTPKRATAGEGHSAFLGPAAGAGSDQPPPEGSSPASLGPQIDGRLMPPATAPRPRLQHQGRP